MTIQISLPGYLNQENKLAHIGEVAKFIDKTLVENFSNKRIVLRGVQSAKSSYSKTELIKNIVENGTDYTEVASKYEVKVIEKQVDIYGLLCKVAPGIAISLPILEGFHKWAPKALERPQYPADIWMIYNAVQLTNVAYKHPRYKVTTKDGWKFKDPEHKDAALLGIIEIT